MKTLSYSQQQLLAVLQIAPLKLKPAFSPAATTELQAETVVDFEPEPLQHAELTSELAQDINLALPEGYNWYIGKHILSAELKDKQLVTPDLSVLQQADIKRALWQLLGAADEN